VLRSASGLRTVSCSAAGHVAALHVQRGQRVAQDQLVATIDASALRSALWAAEKEQQAAQARFDEAKTQGSALFARAMASFEHRISTTRRRIAEKHADVSRLGLSTRRYRELAEQGLVAATEHESAVGLLSSAEQEALGLEGELASVLAQVSASKLDRDTLLSGYAQDAASARAKVEAIRIQLTTGEIRAPASGIVDAVLVTEGEQVSEGAVVARIAPVEIPGTVVAFFPERDRAFIAEGASAQLDIDRLPTGEFGSVAARVSRVSQELALQREVVSALGENATPADLIRVELSVVDSPESRRLAKYLRSGTLASVRLRLRERRVIELLFDPIRRLVSS
jgi:multidrug resistance efflux pump